MACNDILRSIRDTLKLDDASMLAIFAASGREMGLTTIASLVSREEDDNYIPCATPILGFFLDGLIIHKRGRKEGQPAVAAPAMKLTRNDIIKKLRIALDLKEDDIVAIFISGGMEISKNELSSLFRKEGNKHYKECSGEQFYCFMKGLAQHCAGGF